MNPDIIMFCAGLGIGATTVALSMLGALWFASKVPSDDA